MILGPSHYLRSLLRRRNPEPPCKGGQLSVVLDPCTMLVVDDAEGCPVVISLEELWQEWNNGDFDYHAREAIERELSDQRVAIVDGGDTQITVRFAKSSDLGISAPAHWRESNPDLDSCVMTASQWAKGAEDRRRRLEACGAAPDLSEAAVSRAAGRLSERRWTLPEDQRWVQAKYLR